MLKYTLGLIIQGSRILLLSRENAEWMGCWNGVGGKLELGETPRESMLREIQEETGLVLLEEQLEFKGYMTWSDELGNNTGGMYLYLGHLPEKDVYNTPRRTDEGILDWKESEWILHPDNRGISENLSCCLAHILTHEGTYNYYSVFRDHTILKQFYWELDAELEHSAEKRARHWEQFVSEACVRT